MMHKSSCASHTFTVVVLLMSGPAAVLAQPAEVPRSGYEAEPAPGFTARVDPDGSVTLVDRPSIEVDGLGVSFDITDILMRRRGMDPYASAKLKYLDNSRDERVAMGTAYRQLQLAHSGELMRAHIDEVMATIPDPRLRKQALFALWDECAESGEPELVAGGKAARAALVDFVQYDLTGPDAFTPAEIRQLNAHRTSTAVFAPHAASEERVASVTPPRSGGQVRLP